MRLTDQIDDPTWQDIQDRDAEIERLRAALGQDEEIPTTIAGWQRVIHQYAKDKGWWDKERSIGDIFMLFTSEVVEAYEEYRNGRGLNETYYDPDKPDKPEGVPTELADVIIRIFDFAEWAGIDLQAIMAEKHRFNLTRPYRHGNKRT